MVAVPCVDPALEVVQVVLAAMRQAFDPDPDGACPPDGGGTTDVRFFATDNAGMPKGLIPGCDSGPLVWVRLDRRYKSRRSEFPAAFVGDGPCNAAHVIPVLSLEIGVTRCSSMEAQYIDWDAIDREELIALDDSWRISTAQNVAACRLRSDSRAVATDTVAAMGPEGGFRGMTGALYVQLTKP